MAPLMFGGMILFMLIGYPAAFSLAAIGLFFGFIGIELGLISAGLPRQPDLSAVRHHLERPAAGDPVLHLHGRDPRALRPGRGSARIRSASCSARCAAGLSYAVIFVGAILGAITGTVAASVIAMGVISMPPMMQYGYSTRHTMGVIAASGTITQLIPPSLVLIVLADQLGRSVGDMYAGAIGPSIIQVALFCVWVADRQHHLAEGRAGAAARGAHAAAAGRCGRSACAA